MPELVVVDTNCLIVLTRINHLHLLHQVYEKLIIDESKGRKLAKKLGIKLHYLDALEKAGFRFDDKLREVILKSAEEY